MTPTAVRRPATYLLLWAAVMACQSKLFTITIAEEDQTVVEQGEDIGGDLFAQPVAGAEILVDPDLHVIRDSFGGD